MGTASGGLEGVGTVRSSVIVDAGRLGLANSPEPLIYGADLALLTVRSDLVALSGARSWAETLRSGFDAMGAEQRLGVLLVGEGRPYTSRNVAKVLGVPVTASLAWDERSAAVFSHGNQPGRRFDGAALPRSLRAAQASLESALTVSRESLDVFRWAEVGDECPSWPCR